MSNLKQENTLLSVKDQKARRRSHIGAAYLIATSAVGPGFLTQTAVFTESLLASFGFVIFISILLDIGAQLNVWRIISVSGLRGQEIANKVLPGLGFVVAIFIVIGGLAFNIGNFVGIVFGMYVAIGLVMIIGAVI